MLKVLRNKKLMKIIMWSLVIIFAAWGIGSISTSGKLYAGSIFGRKISTQEYNRSYSAVLNRARMIYGEELPKVEKFLDLKNQAWDRLILLHEARSRRIRASNDEVIARIAGFSFFQRDNAFDRGLYEYILASVFRVSPNEFEESMRGDIMIEKLMDQVTGDIVVTENQAKQAYKEKNESADISFIVVSPESHKQGIDVERESVLSFYNDNPDMFVSPAMVNAEYLSVPYKEDNIENARFIIDELHAKAKKGNTLEELAKTYELDLIETGNFSINSEIPGIGVSYPFTLTAFTLEKGQISEVVEIPNAFCLISVKSKTEPSPLAFDLAKDRARDMLIREKASSKAFEQAKDIAAAIQKQGLSLEQAAEKWDYQLYKTKNISRTDYIEEAGRSEELAAIVFSLATGETSKPIETDKGYVVARLDSLAPIDEDLYAKEKQDFIEEITQDKRNQAFQAWFTELKQQANLKDNI